MKALQNCAIFLPTARELLAVHLSDRFFCSFEKAVNIFSTYRENSNCNFFIRVLNTAMQISNQIFMYKIKLYQVS